MKTLNILICTIILFASLSSFGQEEESEDFKHHSISVLLSHSIIFEGLENGKKTTISLPSWALNYNYNFNEKWAIGLHNDIIIENFNIEKTSGGETIERSKPITALLVGTYKIAESIGLELGAGMEFEKNENFAVTRIGAEYGIEIPKFNMEVLLGFDYDIIFDAYNSINLGIGIAKKF